MKLSEVFVATPGLLEHSFAVFDLLQQVIDYLPDVTADQERDLLTAALYHDLGKSTWSTDWFTKPRALIRNQDWTVMQTHPIQSINIIRQLGLSVTDNAQKIILQHHERPGGNGYLLGIEPDYITLVFASCDVYSACTEDRSYRSMPLTPGQALAEIKKFAPASVYDALKHVTNKSA